MGFDGFPFARPTTIGQPVSDAMTKVLETPTRLYVTGGSAVLEQTNKQLDDRIPVAPIYLKPAKNGLGSTMTMAAMSKQ